MSYATQAKLARDTDILERIVACAASLQIKNPTQWVWDIQWVWSAQPGWDDAYAYAIAAKNDNPGLDEGVISDGMILSAVTVVMGQYVPDLITTTT
jgi:hypothetical protein